MTQENVKADYFWQKKLSHIVEDLPEEKKQEVLHFAEYLRHRQNESSLELQKSKNQTEKSSFEKWKGLGLKGKINHNPRFKTEDDLWSNDL